MHQDKGSGSHMVILILWQMLLAAFKRIHIMLENAEKEDRSEILFTSPVGYPPPSLFSKSVTNTMFSPATSCLRKTQMHILILSF